MFTKTKCITGSQKKVEHMIAVLGIYVTKRSFNSSQLTWIQFSYSFRNSAVSCAKLYAMINLIRSEFLKFLN